MLLNWDVEGVIILCALDLMSLEHCYGGFDVSKVNIFKSWFEFLALVELFESFKPWLLLLVMHHELEHCFQLYLIMICLMLTFFSMSGSFMLNWAFNHHVIHAQPRSFSMQIALNFLRHEVTLLVNSRLTAWFVAFPNLTRHIWRRCLWIRYL